MKTIDLKELEELKEDARNEIESLRNQNDVLMKKIGELTNAEGHDFQTLVDRITTNTQHINFKLGVFGTLNKIVKNTHTIQQL